MAKTNKTRKSMTGKTKSVIALALLLVVTLIVSYIGIAGMQLGPEQSRKLLSWMPVSTEMEAFTLSRAYGNMVEVNSTYAPVEGSDATVEDVIAVIEERFEAYGVRNAKVEKTSDTSILVKIPEYADYDMIASLTGTVGLVEFRDTEGNVLMNNDDIASCKLMQADGYHYIQMTTTKEGKQRLNDATTATLYSTMPVYLDGQQMIDPSVTEVNNQGVMTLSFGLPEDATRGLASMLESGALPMNVAESTMLVVANENAGALSCVLLVMWIIFVLSCVYMVVRYRAAGLGAAWALWAYMLLFFFLMGAVTLVLVDTAVWVCIVAGEILCVCVMYEQLKGMKQAVLSGRDAAQAVRMGLRASSKKNWLYYGVLLAVSLVLMILNATRPYGYVLATAVVSGICASLVLARVFVSCLVSAVGGKTCAITGK